MVYFVIIRGSLGVGKSTIAKKLAEKIGAEYFCLDKVMNAHNLLNVDEKLGCVPLENFLEIDKIILPKIKKRIIAGKIAIIECCFYHKEHLKHILSLLRFPHYIFTLTANIEVCIERDKNREKSLGEKAAREVHALVSKFDQGTVINNQTKTEEETLTEILSYLPKF